MVTATDQPRAAPQLQEPADASLLQAPPLNGMGEGSRLSIAALQRRPTNHAFNRKSILELKTSWLPLTAPLASPGRTVPEAPTFVERKPPVEKEATLSCRLNAKSISLFVFIVLAIIALLVVGVDLIRQTGIDQADGTNLNPLELSFQMGPKTWVVGGSYVLLAAVAIGLAVNRLVTVRSAIHSIPSLYVPIQKEDVPEHVYKHLQQEFKRVKSVDLDPTQAEAVRKGWGLVELPLSEEEKKNKRLKEEPLKREFKKRMRKDDSNKAETALKFVHYKRSLIQSLGLVYRLGEMIPMDTEHVLGMKHHGRPPWMTVRQYLDFLKDTFDIHQRIVQFYGEVYYKAKYSPHELEAKEYQDAMKCLVMITKKLKQFIPQENRPPVSSSSEAE